MAQAPAAPGRPRFEIGSIVQQAVKLGHMTRTVGAQVVRRSSRRTWNTQKVSTGPRAVPPHRVWQRLSMGTIRASMSIVTQRLLGQSARWRQVEHQHARLGWMIARGRSPDGLRGALHGLFVASAGCWCRECPARRAPRSRGPHR